MTNEEAEIAKNLKRRIWRLNNLYTIVNKHGKKVRFQMSKEQIKLYDNLHYQNVILKARQLGMTTFIQIFMLDACLFNSDTYAGVIAHNREDAEDFFSKKIKFAYDNLPSQIKALRPCVQDSAKMLTFNNGSSIRVGTSLRSGTYHYLHISEFGKICARYPEKAKEIVTGALNTVHAGQFVFIESTAEGRDGYFYQFCKDAQAIDENCDDLTELDMKFHFFPWYENEGYAIPSSIVSISAELKRYFEGLEDKGITLSDNQKAWYAKKVKTQDDDMKREYPSTPEEAFEKAIEGAYYAKQLAKARKDGRVSKVPYDPALVVNTVFDLGHNDATAIWLHQKVGKENRLIGYYECNGEGLAHYSKWLQDWSRNNDDVTFGTYYMPHDVEVTELGSGDTRKTTAENLGMKPIETIPRTKSVNDDIEEVRNFIASCWFDKEACALGLKNLENYRKAWDDKNGVFRSKPLHDWSSNGADSFRYLAMAMKNDVEFDAAPLNYNNSGIA